MMDIFLTTKYTFSPSAKLEAFTYYRMEYELYLNLVVMEAIG